MSIQPNQLNSSKTKRKTILEKVMANTELKNRT